MRRIFLGVYNPSIVVSYLGVLFSILAMMALIVDPFDPVDPLYLSMALLFLAGICDLLDGTIARSIERSAMEKRFGVELDSLSDIVSFVVLPVLILMYACGFSWHSLLVAFLYVFAGSMRLGWFNLTVDEANGYFTGVPVTFSSVLLPVTVASLKVLDLGIHIPAVIEVLCLILGLLFILNFRMKRMGLLGGTIWVVIGSMSFVALLV